MTETPPFPGPSTAASSSSSQAASTATLTTVTPKGVGNLPEHRHCEVCGKSMAMGERVCSPDCQKRFDEALKARKKSMWMFMGLIALVLLFSVYGRTLLG